MRKFDTEKPQSPAFGFAPRPVAPSSRISPPDPVAAPGNGEIAVGWLWEMAHTEVGRRLLDRLVADLAEHAQVEQHPSMEGRQMVMIFGARKK